MKETADKGKMRMGETAYAYADDYDQSMGRPSTVDCRGRKSKVDWS
jgi:hypothetical protein